MPSFVDIRALNIDSAAGRPLGGIFDFSGWFAGL
jgi:hypothetical protein